jgi:hypothetical protein
MADLKRDTICARRRFNPLSRCTVALALKSPSVKVSYRGKKRSRRYTKRQTQRPIVARISG